MKNFKDAAPVTVRLPAELNNRVEIAAERECRSFSGQIAKALEMQPRKTRPRHDCVGGDNQRSEPGL
jgi:predicted transcriptional regulator